jgi:hypothetical protein
MILLLNDVRLTLNQSPINYYKELCKRDTYGIAKDFYEEYEYAKNIMHITVLFYNEREKCIYYEDGTLVNKDVSGLYLFRGDVNVARRISYMLHLFEYNGLIPIISKQDYFINEWWINYYGSLITNRKINVISGIELLYEDRKKELFEYYGKPFFVKTLYKHISTIYDGEPENFDICLIQETANIVISEFMNILKDDFGTREYRCWIINKEIFSISRYEEVEITQNEEKIVREFVNKKLKHINSISPKHFIIDVCELQDGTFDVVEINDMSSSGRYFKNKVDYLSKL